MNKTMIHKIFGFLKRILPLRIARFLRSAITAFWTPVYFSYLNGHFVSSFLNKSVSRKDEAMPWYTYPAIDFLRTRKFDSKNVLEFGGGQSTLWWATRAKRVVTFEDNKKWGESLMKAVPGNAEIFLVSSELAEKCVGEVMDKLNNLKEIKFDVIVIDGLWRREMVKVAQNRLAEHGAIICDNAEGYGFYEEFKNSGMKRIDFFGHAPGVLLPHCTSIFFKNDCFLFNTDFSIPVLV